MRRIEFKHILKEIIREQEKDTERTVGILCALFGRIPKFREFMRQTGDSANNSFRKNTASQLKQHETRQMQLRKAIDSTESVTDFIEVIKGGCCKSGQLKQPE